MEVSKLLRSGYEDSTWRSSLKPTNGVAGKKGERWPRVIFPFLACLGLLGFVYAIAYTVIAINQTCLFFRRAWRRVLGVAE